MGRARAAVPGENCSSLPKFCILVSLQPPLPCLHRSSFPSQQMGSQEGWELQICCSIPPGDEGFGGKETKNLYLIFLGADSQPLSCSTGKETPTLLSQGESLHPSALLLQEEGLKQRIQIYSKKALGS